MMQHKRYILFFTLFFSVLTNAGPLESGVGQVASAPFADLLPAHDELSMFELAEMEPLPVLVIELIALPPISWIDPEPEIRWICSCMYSVTIPLTQIIVVPDPSLVALPQTLGLTLLGLSGVILIRRKRRSKTPSNLDI